MAEGLPPGSTREVTVEEALRIAMGLHREGRLDEARRIYEQVLVAAPDHPDVLHYLGLLMHRQGEREQGIALVRRALERVPDYRDALNNLGNLLKQQNRLDEAEACFRRALALAPDVPEARNNLGTLLRQRGDLDGAIEQLERAVTLRPGWADAHYNLGNALRGAGRFEEAMVAYRRVLALEPAHALAAHRLGTTLLRFARFDQARAVYDALLEVAPDDPVARHMRAAVSGEAVPERASDAYVGEMFDRLAEEFDEHLAALDYRAPQLVAEALPGTLGPPRGGLDVLDAGCGTGLCGPALRPYARRLTGVDLSAGMLARARERGGYDRLEAAELTAFLRESPGAFDLVVSADTLCYFGDLGPVLAAAAAALRPGGSLLFTVERLDEGAGAPGFVLHPYGRYAHREAYLRATLAAAGLETTRCDGAVLRKEAGQPVAGLLVAARKPRGDAVKEG